MLRRVFIFSLLIFSFHSYATTLDVNGCPNANLAGFWSVSVDWTCSGSRPDTTGWFLDTDGRGYNDSGVPIVWRCEGEKVFVNYPTHNTEFSGIYGDGSSMSGKVVRGPEVGCWVAAHLSTINPPQDTTYRSQYTKPPTGQLPPPIYGIPCPAYASPSNCGP